MVRSATKRRGRSVELMTIPQASDLTDPSVVERVLRDRRFRVVEADASASRPLGRFRAAVSRFVEGPVHAERRRGVEALLDRLDPEELGTTARLLARRESDDCVDMAGDDRVEYLADRVPVICLAGHLGFTDSAGLPSLVAAVAVMYPTGAPTAGPARDATDDGAADAAVERLLAAAGEAPDAALRVQLLVQAYAATAGLIRSSIRLSTADDAAAEEGAGRSPAALVDLVLHDDPPVSTTRRVGADGAIVTLSLRAPRDADPSLAFGAGTRSCPASRHALAIATAVIAELLAC